MLTFKQNLNLSKDMLIINNGMIKTLFELFNKNFDIFILPILWIQKRFCFKLLVMIQNDIKIE